MVCCYLHPLTHHYRCIISQGNLKRAWSFYMLQCWTKLSRCLSNVSWKVFNKEDSTAWNCSDSHPFRKWVLISLNTSFCPVLLCFHHRMYKTVYYFLLCSFFLVAWRTLLCLPKCFLKLNASNLFHKVIFSRSLTVSPPSPLVSLQMLCTFFEMPCTDSVIGVPAEALPEWKGHFAYLAHDIAARAPLGDICFYHCNVTRLTPAVYTAKLNCNLTSCSSCYI